MIFCQQCGTSVMEHQPNCPHCGAEIETDTTSESTQGDVAAGTESVAHEYATAPNDAPLFLTLPGNAAGGVFAA